MAEAATITTNIVSGTVTAASVVSGTSITAAIVTGAAGSAGSAGATGATGVGVPTGGTTGQILAKTSGTDYATGWVAQTGGSADFNVSDYGAVGNGTTDDYAAIMAAVNAAYAAGGGTVRLKAKPYAISQPINLAGKSGITIKGENRKTSLLIPSAYLSNFSFSYMITGNNTATDIRVEGITFDGNFAAYGTPGGSRGGGISPCYRWFVNNCQFQNFNYFPVWLGTDCKDSKIFNCLFTGTVGGGLDNIGGGGAQNVEIAYNQWNVGIMGNNFDNTGGTYFNIHHNIFYSNSGFYIEAMQHIDVHHNWFYNGTGIGAISDAGYNPTVITNPRYIKIRNNTFDGGGIHYAATTHATKTVSVGGDVEITGNDIIGSQYGGILVDGGDNGIATWGRGYIINGNKIRNVNASNTNTWNTGLGIANPSGINVFIGTDVLISDNIIVDDRATPQMYYGIMVGQTYAPSALNQANNVTVMDNHITGVITAKTRRVNSTYTNNYYEVTDGSNIAGVAAPFSVTQSDVASNNTAISATNNGPGSAIVATATGARNANAYYGSAGYFQSSGSANGTTLSSFRSVPATSSFANPSAGLDVQSTAAETSVSLARIDMANAGATKSTLKLGNAGTGAALEIVSGYISGLQDKGGQVNNVKAYGAKGDGTTDDTVAIQAALTACSGTGGTVYFPAGTFITAALNIYSKTIILGSGRASSILKLKATTNTYMFTTYDVAPTGTTYPQDHAFKSIGFDGNMANNTTAAGFILSTKNRNLTVQDCKIQGFVGAAIRLDGSAGNNIQPRIMDNQFDMGSRTSGVAIDIESGCSDSWITGNDCGRSFRGIILSNGGEGNHSVLNNWCWGNADMGILNYQSHYNLFSNNTVDQNFGAGMEIQGSHDLQISNMKFSNNSFRDVTGQFGFGVIGTVNNADGLRVVSTSTNIRLTACIFDNPNGGQRYGIQAESTSNVYYDANTIFAPSAPMNTGKINILTGATITDLGVVTVTPAGVDKQLQFNNGGILGANIGLVWDTTNSRLGVGAIAGGAVRTNLVINPNFETGVVSWTNFGSTQLWSTTVAFLGTGSLQITGSGGIPVGIYYFTPTIGQVYTASAYIKGVAGQTAQMQAYNTGAGGTAVTLTGGWDRISYTWTANAATVNIQIVGNTTNATINIDAVLLEISGSVGSYFDGATTATNHVYAWSGAANASTSTDTPLAINVPATTLDVHGTLTATTFIGSGASLTGIPESAVTNLTSDLAAKANLVAPAFTGVPTAPTASPSTNSTQLSTTAYTDAAVAAMAAGLTWKTSVRAATTTNATLATAYANASIIDGVTLVTSDRLLIKNQTTASENGIYVVAVSGAPARANDANSSTNLVDNTAVFVQEGTTNADTGWTLTNNGVITPGTTSLTFTQFTGATVSGATSSTLGTIQLTNDIGGTAALPTVTATHLAAALPILQGGTGSTTSTGTGSTVLSASPIFTGTVTIPTGASITAPTGLVKVDVGLGNVDNTSDATKLSTTRTLTNARITKRTGTTTSSATPTINSDNVDFYSITSLAVAITSFTTSLTGTPTDAQTLWISITDNGTARAIAWGTSFEASTNPLPITTIVSARIDIGFIWNIATSKWRCIAST